VHAIDLKGLYLSKLDLNGLLKGMTIDEARKRSLDDTLLHQRTHASRHKKEVIVTIFGKVSSFWDNL